MGPDDNEGIGFYALFYRSLKPNDRRIFGDISIGQGLSEFIVFDSMFDVMDFINSRGLFFVTALLNALQFMVQEEHEWHDRVRELKGLKGDCIVTRVSDTSVSE